MNRYRVLLPVTVNGDFGQGDEFDYEFATPEAEQSNLDSGLLEIVPRAYRVTGPVKVYDTDPGGEFTAAFSIGQEAHLVEAGHIERVEPKKADEKTAKKAGAKEKATG